MSYLSTAVHGVSRSTRFSHLKKTHIKTSVQVDAIFRIFSVLLWRQTALSDKELKPLYPSTLSSKPPDSFDENRNFTSQNMGASSLPLLRLIGLFILFSLDPNTHLKTQKSHNNIKTISSSVLYEGGRRHPLPSSS